MGRRGWGGGGGDTETKTVCQTVKRGKIQNSNHLHNVMHVVQSTLQNFKLLKYKPYSSNFELSSK